MWCWPVLLGARPGLHAAGSRSAALAVQLVLQGVRLGLKVLGAGVPAVLADAVDQSTGGGHLRGLLLARVGGPRLFVHLALHAAAAAEQAHQGSSRVGVVGGRSGRASVRLVTTS